MKKGIGYFLVLFIMTTAGCAWVISSSYTLNKKDFPNQEEKSCFKEISYSFSYPWEITSESVMAQLENSKVTYEFSAYSLVNSIVEWLIFRIDDIDHRYLMEFSSSSSKTNIKIKSCGSFDLIKNDMEIVKKKLKLIYD